MWTTRWTGAVARSTAGEAPQDTTPTNGHGMLLGTAPAVRGLSGRCSASPTRCSQTVAMTTTPAPLMSGLGALSRNRPARAIRSAEEAGWSSNPKIRAAHAMNRTHERPLAIDHVAGRESNRASGSLRTVSSFNLRTDRVRESVSAPREAPVSLRAVFSFSRCSSSSWVAPAPSIRTRIFAGLECD